tara:strand:+ start:328 stop:459 length:132 start_codon:yes stop_codon:yes gene_type:complete
MNLGEFGKIIVSKSFDGLWITPCIIPDLIKDGNNNPIDSFPAP